MRDREQKKNRGNLFFLEKEKQSNIEWNLLRLIGVHIKQSFIESIESVI